MYFEGSRDPYAVDTTREPQLLDHLNSPTDYAFLSAIYIRTYFATQKYHTCSTISFINMTISLYCVWCELYPSYIISSRIVKKKGEESVRRRCQKILLCFQQGRCLPHTFDTNKYVCKK